MIYIERTIKIKKGEASIDEPVCLYKGDKNIEIRFLIENNPFKYKNDLTINYGQLIIKRENAPDIFSEPTKLNSGRIIFLITGDMINDLNELGNYTFQIRILNEDLTSRGTLPPVFAGITIKEPLCEEPPEPPTPTIYDIRSNGGTDCSYLFHNYDAESLDLSNCDVSNITNMSFMFNECETLTTLNLSGWKTDGIVNMSHMFYSCNNLTELNLNGAKINPSNMFATFQSCSKLTTIDLSGFNTSNLTGINKTFYTCIALTTIIGKIDASNLTSGFYNSSSNNPFYLCVSLETVYFKNIYKNCSMTNESKWSINLSHTKVKEECLVYIINELPNLYDKGLTTTDKIILTLPATNTLTAEQVQVAVDKGWSVANTTY
jgi:surface protein